MLEGSNEEHGFLRRSTRSDNNPSRSEEEIRGLLGRPPGGNNPLDRLAKPEGFLSRVTEKVRAVNLWRVAWVFGALVLLWGVMSYLFPNPVTVLSCGTQVSPLDSRIKGIVRICVSKCDVQIMCVSLASAFAVANYRGPQFIVTDQANKIREQCDVPNLVFVDAPTPELPFGSTNSAKRENSMYRLQVKSTMWELFGLSPEPESILLYSDSDLIFTGCIKDQVLIHESALALFPDNICSQCNEFNMGISFSRPSASSCFSSVLHEMTLDEINAREQVALDRVRAKGSSCSDIERIPRPRIVFVSFDLITPRLQRLAALLGGYGKPGFAHYGHATRYKWFWPRILKSIQTEISDVPPHLGTKFVWPDPSEVYVAEEILFYTVLGIGLVWTYIRSRKKPKRRTILRN